MMVFAGTYRMRDAHIGTFADPPGASLAALPPQRRFDEIARAKACPLPEKV